MVGQDFIDNYRKFQGVALVGVQDFADRLSYLHTVIILLIATIVVTAKTYVLKPLSCHIPTVPSGSAFGSYLESFCWITGSVPFRINETIPENQEEWQTWSEERKIRTSGFRSGLHCGVF